MNSCSRWQLRGEGPRKHHGEARVRLRFPSKEVSKKREGNTYQGLERKPQEVEEGKCLSFLVCAANGEVYVLGFKIRKRMVLMLKMSMCRKGGGVLTLGRSSKADGLLLKVSMCRRRGKCTYRVRGRRRSSEVYYGRSASVVNVEVCVR
jgi:hypothetical protein